MMHDACHLFLLQFIHNRSVRFSNEEENIFYMQHSIVDIKIDVDTRCRMFSVYFSTTGIKIYD